MSKKEEKPVQEKTPLLKADKVKKLSFSKVNLRSRKLHIALAVLLVATALLLVVIDKEDQTAKKGTTSAADFRTNLSTLGAEHVALTNRALVAQLDGSKDADALKTELYKNTQEVSDALAVSGSEPQQIFSNTWKTYLDQLYAYADASKKGDAAAKKAAQDKIAAEYVAPIQQFFDSSEVLQSNIPERAFEDYAFLITKTIDDHAQGKLQEEASGVEEAKIQLTTAFDALANALARQSPDKFRN
jgi:hypothetical protein